MKHQPLIKIFISLLVAVIFSLSLFQPGLARPDNRPAGIDGPERGYDPGTGQLIFLGTTPDQPIPSTLGEVGALDVEENTLAFISAYSAEMGLGDPTDELQVTSAKTSSNGHSTTRYQQMFQGLPVFGGNVVVNTNDTGALLALSAKISPNLAMDTTPTITAEEAREIAKELVVKYYNADPGEATVSEPSLWIYDEQLLLPTTHPPQLVWQMEASAGEMVRELVLVNARNGGITLHFNQVDTSWVKGNGPRPASAQHDEMSAQVLGTPLIEVHTMNHNCTPDDLSCSGVGTTPLPGILVCDQSDPSACDSDADAHDAYWYTDDTYDFYATYHSRDSLDGSGMTIKSSVHYGSNYPSAFWNGSQMVYGDGFIADDLVGHELTHAVTNNESALYYYAQPGAISESFSDLWGEFIDLGNGSGTDIVAVRWLLGEDTPGVGAVRSMKNPPAFQDPDTMTSAYYYTGYADNAGVYTNNGVNNKAVYLMVDGGTFNGKTIHALGIEKAADIYYEVQTNLLGNSANYLDLYYALYQACVNLVGTDGITISDCQDVRNATDAVQMNMTKSASMYPTAPKCPTGTEFYQQLFYDDFESDPTSQWTFGTIAGPQRWEWNTESSPDGEWATSGSGSLRSNSYDSTSDSWAQITSAIALPSGVKAYLQFDHDYRFEDTFDGGVIEYSTDGSTWNDIDPLYGLGQRYNKTLSPVLNPMGNRKAFTGATPTGTYVSTRYDLAPLAGQNVYLRWRAGYDVSITTGWGWFLDNVSLHSCVGIPGIPTLSAPASNALLPDHTPTLNWTDSTPDVHAYQLQVAADNTFTPPLVYDEDTGTTSEFYIPTPLYPNATYYWRVQAWNVLDQTKGWSLVRSFRTGMMPPVLISPIDGDPVHTKRPAFDWDNVLGATSYTIQISRNNTFTLLANTSNVTLSTYTPTIDLPINMLLYWRVKAYGINPSNWSEVRSLTTGNPPGVPTLLLPASNALTTDYTPRLDWAQSTLPTGTTFSKYELEVDNNADFSSPEITADITSLSTHEYTPATDLNANTKYYWRVRSWNTNNDYSSWSPVRYFRTAMVPPVLVSPGNGDSVHTDRPTIDWDDVVGASGYNLQVSKVSTFSPLTLTVNPATSTYTPTNDFEVNMLFYWRVKANGSNGPSDSSEVRSLTTGNPPSVPGLLSPASNALTTDYTPRLDWGQSTLPTGTTFSKYELEVDNNADFSSPEITADITSLTTHEYTPATDLNANTKYYWRVRSWNTNLDYSGWSLVRYFRTAIVKPTLLSPINGEIVGSLKPAFDWGDVSGASGYIIQVSRNASFTTIVLTITIPKPVSTYTPTTNLPAATTLYWRVMANGANGPSLWAAYEDFVTP
jgi:Zn-dependent metalloprotease